MTVIHSHIGRFWEETVSELVVGLKTMRRQHLYMRS